MRNQSRGVFRNIPQKSKDVIVKRLHDTQIREIEENPYHEQQVHTKEVLKVKRGLPLADGKEEFHNYIPLTGQPFSNPEIMDDLNITPQEKDRLEIEKKKKER